MSETLKPDNCLYCGSSRVETGTCRKCGAVYNHHYERPQPRRDAGLLRFENGELDRLRRRDTSWKNGMKKKRSKNVKPAEDRLS